MKVADALKVFDLEPPIEPAQLKRAYREALKVWHPDRFADRSELQTKAALKTQLFNEAYALLKRIPEDEFPFRSVAFEQVPKTASFSNDGNIGPMHNHDERRETPPSARRANAPEPWHQFHTEAWIWIRFLVQRKPFLLISILGCATVILAMVLNLGSYVSAPLPSHNQVQQADASIQNLDQAADTSNFSLPAYAHQTPKVDVKDPDINLAAEDIDDMAAKILGAIQGQRKADAIPKPKPIDLDDKELTAWYKWVNLAGKTIEAKFIELIDDKVSLETRDHKTWLVEIGTLSPDSQALASRLERLRKELSARQRRARSIELAEAAERVRQIEDSTPKPLPETGVLNGSFIQTSSSGPLTVRTRSGSGHFFVKLVQAGSSEDPFTFFIREGETISRLPIPSGTYEMRYACGKTWFGERALFGPDTTYHRADSTFHFGYGSGYTVELFLQRFGNLNTLSLPKSQF